MAGPDGENRPAHFYADARLRRVADYYKLIHFLALTPERILAVIAKENGNGNHATAPVQP